jgi:excinuclease ABC subunit B
MTIEESIAADPLIKTMNHDQLRKTIEQTKKNMERAAKDMDFMEAARLRDEMFALQKLVDNPTVS